jgi:hypothetical protein
MLNQHKAEKLLLLAIALASPARVAFVGRRVHADHHGVTVLYLRLRPPVVQHQATNCHTYGIIGHAAVDISAIVVQDFN